MIKLFSREVIVVFPQSADIKDNAQACQYLSFLELIINSIIVLNIFRKVVTNKNQ